MSHSLHPLPAGIRAVAGPAPARTSPATTSRNEPSHETARTESRGAAPATTSAAEAAALERLEAFVQVAQRDLRFTRDEASGRTVVTVIDAESGEVIRQIPAEALLEIARHLSDVTGVLLEDRA